jgi:5-methylcytosine-specific restriction endonuclease McrA
MAAFEVITEGDRWQADHVLAHATGGEDSWENFLPAHALCNNYRWDYSAEEFQLILKLGVWTRNQIMNRRRLGLEVAEQFALYEERREKRRNR